MLNVKTLVITCVALLAVAEAAIGQHHYIGFDAITIPDTGTTTGPSAPYPDFIPVSGVRRPIESVRVTLSNFAHTYPDDLDIVLVSPAGLAVVLMSDAGGSLPFSGTLRFGAGASAVPDDGPLASFATYGPADYLPGDVPPGLPAGLTFTTLEGLAGSDANGYWSVYVYDDATDDIGRMDPPELFITEAHQGTIVIDAVGQGAALPDVTTVRRYLRVGGLDGPVHNLRLKLFGLSHTYPRDLDIGVIDPAGQPYVMMSDAGGTSPVGGVDLELGMFPVPVPVDTLASGRYSATNYSDTGPDIAGVTGTALAEGRNGSGVWTLIIMDDTPQDAGSLAGWSLSFDPPCESDFNRNGITTVQDVFDFLTSWFAGCP